MGGEGVLVMNHEGVLVMNHECVLRGCVVRVSLVVPTYGNLSHDDRWWVVVSALLMTIQ